MIAAVEARGAEFRRCRQRQEYAIALQGDRDFAEVEDTYVVVRSGARELTEAESRELPSRLFDALMPSGLQSAGIGGCSCDAGGPAQRGQLCIVAEANENTLGPQHVADALARIVAELALKEVTVRVQVSLLSAPGPRCRPDDPACGPLPYYGECAEQSDYDADDERILVRGSRDDRCSHDGECVQGGCGNFCVSAKRPPMIGTCEAIGELEEAWCGCVNGYCGWFVQ